MNLKRLFTLFLTVSLLICTASCAAENTVSAETGSAAELISYLIAKL